MAGGERGLAGASLERHRHHPIGRRVGIAIVVALAPRRRAAECAPTGETRALLTGAIDGQTDDQRAGIVVDADVVRRAIRREWIAEPGLRQRGPFASSRRRLSWVKPSRCVVLFWS
jgi:hypothetical protein